MTKRIKEDYPGIQILPLELDPDTSFANVENRLQMLVMNEKSRCMDTPVPAPAEKNPLSGIKNPGRFLFKLPFAMLEKTLIIKLRNL